MLPTTIDEVITRLESLVKESIDHNRRLGYFAALYLKVTMRVRQGIANGEFEDGTRMAQLDVVFANRFITAAESWLNGKETSACWKVCFDNSKKRSVLVLQHLLLGMNAHINYDLGIAAVEVARSRELKTMRKDFTAINDILGALTFEVMNDLNRISPLLSLFGLHAGNNSTIIQFSLSNARDGAWTFAEELYDLQGNSSTCLASRDESIRKLGQSLVEVKGIIRFTRWLIHLFEMKTPNRITNILYESCRKYLSSAELNVGKKAA